MINLKSVFIRYDKHNRSITTCTDNVKTEKAETEKRLTDVNVAIKELEKEVKKEEEQLKENSEKIRQIDLAMAQINQEIQNCIRQASRKRNRLGFITALVPFVGPLVNSIFGAKIDAGLAANIQALSNKLTQLSNEKSNLRNKEWSIHVKLTTLQLNLANMKITEGEMLSLKRSLVVLNKFHDSHINGY